MIQWERQGIIPAKRRDHEPATLWPAVAVFVFIATIFFLGALIEWSAPLVEHLLPRVP